MIGLVRGQANKRKFSAPVRGIHIYGIDFSELISHLPQNKCTSGGGIEKLICLAHYSVHVRTLCVLPKF